MNYDVLLFPRKHCRICGDELDTKMSIEQMNKQIKFHHICNKCKNASCDTLKLIGTSKEEYTSPTP